MKGANFILAFVVLFVPWCGVASGSLNSAEEKLIVEAKQGERVSLPELMTHRREMPGVALKITPQPGAQLLFSDRPEYFARDGISLQEMVQPGKVRFYVYHVPQPDADSHTITATLKNCGSNELSLHFTHRAFPVPGKDYQRVALEGLLGFLTAEPQKPIRRVLPGQSCVLDALLDHSTATKDQLVHAFFEFEIDQPAQVTVFQRKPTERSLDVLARLPLLSTDPTRRGNGAGRGRFPNADFAVENAAEAILDSANGPVQLIVADGKTDPWIKGYDSIDCTNSTDAGNYGVFYHIRLRRNPHDSNGLALLLCKMRARSPYCGRMAAAMEVSRGEYPGGVVALPTGQPPLGNADEAILAQRFPPPKSDEDAAIEILYSPPGAACLPTPLVFVPYHEVKDGR